MNSPDSGCSDSAAPLGQAQVSRLIRARLDHLLVDDSSTTTQDAAIYTLAEARAAECRRIMDSIAAGHPLFNVEARQAGAQLVLPLS